MLLDSLNEKSVHEFTNRLGVPQFGGFEYPNLTLGNYSALKLAEIYDIDVPWNPDRTPPRGPPFGKMVKAVVEKELVAGKK